MADLIDRQMAIKAVMFGSLGSSTVYGRSEQGMAAQKETVQAIRMLPSAERHGKWISKNSTFKNRWLCSVCGYTWYFDTAQAHYCSHCGARMDGEQHE